MTAPHIVDPARDVKLPRKKKEKKKSRAYLTHQQVEALALESKYPDMVRFLALTGLRWGEATGLRVKHLDLARRRANVKENAVGVSGTVHVGTPKTHERRAVVWPAILDEGITKAIAGRDREALVWSDDGIAHRLLPNSIRGWFSGAVERCQADDPDFPRITPNDLRHAAASPDNGAGANVKAVQRMLGHSSTVMTLDTCTTLFEDDLDSMAEALSDVYSRSNAVATE